MAFLTSYIYEEALFDDVELNDEDNYVIAFTNGDLDSKQPIDPSYAVRDADTPTFLAAPMQNGLLNFEIYIKATTSSNFETKLNVLKRIFMVGNQVEKKFKRKLPHESTHKYILARVKEFTVDRLLRKINVVLHTEDKTWKDATESSASELMLVSSISDTLEVTYDGNEPYEPIIKITLEDQSTNSPRPQYWRESTVFVHDPLQAIGQPLMIINYDATTEVNAGRQRSDGRDISIEDSTGALIPRLVEGSSSDRRIWIKATTWPTNPPLKVMDLASYPVNAAATTIPFVTSSGVPAELPDSGKLAIEDEIITYTGVTYIDTNRKNQGFLTGCSRGEDGTTAAAHVGWSRIKRPVTFTMYYGYGAGYEQTFDNDYQGWPAMDFDTSNNEEWFFPASMRPDEGSVPAATYQVGWTHDIKRPRTGEAIRGDLEGGVNAPSTGDQPILKGRYDTGGSRDSILQRLAINLGSAGRKPDYVKMEFTLTAGSGTLGEVKADMCAAKSGFGSSFEQSTVLFSAASTNVAGQAFDSTYIFINYYRDPITHVFLRVTKTPFAASDIVLVKLDKISLKLDQIWESVPLLHSIGSEQGVMTGKHPWWVAFQNLDDPDAQEFVLAGNSAVGTLITVDADLRTITGTPLLLATNENAVWLELLPGVNRIRFRTQVGGGSITGEIRWRNRY